MIRPACIEEMSAPFEYIRPTNSLIYPIHTNSIATGMQAQPLKYRRLFAFLTDGPKSKPSRTTLGMVVDSNCISALHTTYCMSIKKYPNICKLVRFAHNWNDGVLE